MSLCSLTSVVLALSSCGVIGTVPLEASVFQEGAPRAQSHCGKSPRPAIVAPKPDAGAQAPPTQGTQDNSPCPVADPNADSDALGRAGQPHPPISLRNDLVDVLAPTGKLKLAEENEISLRIHEKGLVRVSTWQNQIDGRNEVVPENLRGSEMAAPIIYKPDGSAAIRVTPLRLGKLQLSVSGIFPDGAVFRRAVTIEVGVPSILPRSLLVYQGGNPFGQAMIRLYLHEQPGRAWMQVRAFYDTVKDPIIIDPTALLFNIRTNDTTPALRLDEATGLLTPLHVGHALIESGFGQHMALTCIVVEEKFDLGSANHDQSRCEELLHSGEQLTLPR